MVNLSFLFCYICYIYLIFILVIFYFLHLGLVIIYFP